MAQSVTAWTDEELSALALAADPDPVLEPDAVPFSMGDPTDGPLPSWYMPRPAARGVKAWHAPVVVTIIVALTVISGLGFCITYGTLVVA